MKGKTMRFYAKSQTRHRTGFLSGGVAYEIDLVADGSKYAVYEVDKNEVHTLLAYETTLAEAKEWAQIHYYS